MSNLIFLQPYIICSSINTGPVSIMNTESNLAFTSNKQGTPNKIEWRHQSWSSWVWWSSPTTAWRMLDTSGTWYLIQATVATISNALVATPYSCPAPRVNLTTLTWKPAVMRTRLPVSGSAPTRRRTTIRCWRSTSYVRRRYPSLPGVELAVCTGSASHPVRFKLFLTSGSAWEDAVISAARTTHHAVAVENRETISNQNSRFQGFIESMLWLPNNCFILQNWERNTLHAIIGTFSWVFRKNTFSSTTKK